MIFVDLINNISLLLSMSIIYWFIISRAEFAPSTRKLLMGSLFGFSAVFGMMIPFEYAPGVIFDGRSMIVSVAGLFGGLLPAVVSIVISSVYRAVLGGTGMWTGIGVIVTSGLIGAIIHHNKRFRQHYHKPVPLYLFGIVVHITMLLWMLTLPIEISYNILKTISFPVLLIFPLATVLFGFVLHSMERQEKTKEQLKKSASILNQTQRITKSGGWEYDVKDQTIYWTEEVYRIHEVDMNTFDPNNLETNISFYEENDQATIQKAFDMALSEGKSYDLTLKLNTALGNKLWVRTIAEVEYKHNRVYRLFGNIIDVTEQIKKEEDLRSSETRFSHAFHSSPAGLTITRIKDGKFIDVNESFLKMFEYSREEVLGSNSTDLKMISLEQKKKLITAQLDSGGLKETELKARSKSGKILTILFSSEPMEIEGEPHHVTIMIDITERKKIEEKLQHSEESYRKLFEYAPYGVLVADQQSYYINANQKLCNMLGYSLSEFVGLHASDIVAPKEIQNIEPEINKIKEIADYWRVWKFIRKDSSTFDAEVSVTMLPDGHLLATIRDITQKQKMELELSINKERFERALENIPDVVVIYDTNLRIQYINSATRAVTGRPSSDFINKTEQELWPPEMYNKYLPALIESKKTKTIRSVETEIKLPDGNIKYLQITCIPLLDTKGDLHEILGVTVDLTEIKQANRELSRFTSHLQNQIEKERTAISREIHDDFGQTLSALKLDIGWMKKRLLPDQSTLSEKMTDMEEMIKESVQTVKKICSELRPALLDDMGLIPALEWLVSNFMGRNDINVNLVHNLDEIILNKTQSISLFRIVQEALTNISRHSKARNVEIELRAEGKEIILKIQDDGIGIQKASSRGGIKSFGILGIKERAATMNGYLNIVSENGHGTMIKVVFNVEN